MMERLVVGRFGHRVHRRYQHFFREILLCGFWYWIGHFNHLNFWWLLALTIPVPVCWFTEYLDSRAAPVWKSSATQLLRWLVSVEAADCRSNIYSGLCSWFLAYFNQAFVLFTAVVFYIELGISIFSGNYLHLLFLCVGPYDCKNPLTLWIEPRTLILFLFLSLYTMRTLNWIPSIIKW